MECYTRIQLTAVERINDTESSKIQEFLPILTFIDQITHTRNTYNNFFTGL